MKLKAIITVNLEKENELLVVVAASKEDQRELYYRLLTGMDKFRKKISNHYPLVARVTAGYWNERDEIVWENPVAL